MSPNVLLKTNNITIYPKLLRL